MANFYSCKIIVHFFFEKMYLCRVDYKIMKIQKISITLIIALLWLFSLESHAQLVFEPAEWNFGTIREVDGRVSHTFTGENRGENPIVILDVITSCGCTVPQFTRRPILAGAKTAITVTFDPTNRSGIFNKELAVYSSERKKIATLTIRGRIEERPKSIEDLYPIAIGKGLRLNISHCSFAYIYPEQLEMCVIGYTNTSSVSLSLELRPQKSTGLLSVSAPRQIRAGESGTINLSYRVPTKPSHYGTLDDVLAIYVDGVASKIPITVHGIVVDAPQKNRKTAPKVQLSENILKFGAIKSSEMAVQRNFRLSNEGTDTLHIRAVEIGNHFTTTLRVGERIAPQKSIAVGVQLNPAGLDPRVLSERLVLITDDPERPMRRVRLTAIVEE